MSKWYKNLTIKGKTDGFGSQYQAIMSLIAYCDFKEDYEYIHTPMYMMHHNDKNEERFPEIMNQFTNLNLAVYIGDTFLDIKNASIPSNLTKLLSLSTALGFK